MEQILWIITWAIISIIIVIVGLIKFKRSKINQDTLTTSKTTGKQSLITLATSLFLLQIIFGSDRLVMYSFFATGLIISIIAFLKYRHAT